MLVGGNYCNIIVHLFRQEFYLIIKDAFHSAGITDRVDAVDDFHKSDL